MSPEQTEGSGTDHRTDIWALGVVIYEMITGQRPFKGDYDKAIMYSILNEEPEPITGLRTSVPMELEVFVSKCLHKLPAKRYSQAGDLAEDLGSAAHRLSAGTSRAVRTTGASQQPPPAAALSALQTQVRLAYGVGVVGLLAAVCIGSLSLLKPDVSTSAPVRRFTMTAANLVSGQISPDGRHILYRTDDGDQSALWVRPLNSDSPRRLTLGSPGASSRGASQFWSPDSRFIFFALDGQLKRVSVEGGDTVKVCDLPGRGFNDLFGGSLDPNGDRLVFSSGLKLYELPARGGEPRLLFEDDPNYRYLTSPTLLRSDGQRWLLHVASSGTGTSNRIMLANLDTGERRELLNGKNPVYSSQGFLLYESATSEDREIWAVPFSLESLEITGEAFPIAQDALFPSLAADGTLVYSDASVLGMQQLIWVDRKGERIGSISHPQIRIRSPNLSPNGTLLVANGRDVSTNANAVWFYDLARDLRRPLTFGSVAVAVLEWHPRGDTVVFSAPPNERMELFQKRVDGSGEAEPLVEGDNLFHPDWSPDGSLLLYTGGSTSNTSLIYRQVQTNGLLGDPVPFLETDASEHAGKFSPDGRFVAYSSNESRRPEVYVRAFPDGNGKWQVSTTGGSQPRWSRDGKELFYVSEEQAALMSVRVRTSPEFSADSPELLFQQGTLCEGGRSPLFDVDLDGQRFVLVERVASEQANLTLHIIQNWQEEFRGRE